MFVNLKSFLVLEIINMVIQFSVDVLVVYYWGGKVLVYMIVSFLLGMGFYLVVGYFIFEYYMFVKGFEIFLYYGFLNFVIFNVGYYNEYYDFSSVFGFRLFLVREIVFEYYKDLLQYYFWIKVFYDFIIDFVIGSYVRMKRKVMKFSKEEEQENCLQNFYCFFNGKGLVQWSGIIS